MATTPKILSQAALVLLVLLSVLASNAADGFLHPNPPPMKAAVAAAVSRPANAGSGKSRRGGCAGGWCGSSALQSAASEEEEGGSSSSTPSSSFDGYSVSDPNQGLAYKDVDVGDGKNFSEGDVVTVKYSGKVMSGRNFATNQQYSFEVGGGRVMPGMEKGLEGMKVGGKRIIRVPPSLAFQDQGARGKIPPGSHLQLECEVVDVADNALTKAVVNFGWDMQTFATFCFLLLVLAITPAFQ